MSERRGTKALELWCRRITEGYPGVNVQNMTTSWKDGLAFCAMIHHFRPDLIDFDSLDKNNVHGNNELAFRIAEQHLGIPALLDAEDMASCSTPDRLSILTYLSQFYQTLGGSSPSRLAINRTTETAEEKITPIPESPKEKAALSLGVRRDPCAVCGLPVFLAEKLVLGRAAYHRTCFRCARCSNQLTLGNYYETEKGQYCCETCPDEELSPATAQSYDKIAMSNRSETSKMFEDFCDNEYFSNEENTSSRTSDDHSATKLDLDDSSVPDIIAQTSRLRLNFISNHLLSNQDTADAIDSKFSANIPDQYENKSTSASVQLEFQSKRNEDSLDDEGSNENLAFERLKFQSIKNERSFDSEDSSERTNRNFAKQYSTNEELKNSDEELTGASCNDVIRNKSIDSATKINASEELLNDETVKHADTANCLSLVQSRLRLFENAKDFTEKRGNQSIEVLRPTTQYKEHNVTKKDFKDPTINLDVTEIRESTSNLKVLENIADSPVNDALDDTSFSKLTSLRISETIDSPGDALEDSTKNSSTEQVENDTMIHSQISTNNENQAFITVASETVSTSTTSAATKIDYPKDLNPFNSDEEEESDIHSIITMNSLKSEETIKEEFQKKELVIPKPAVRNNIDNNTGKSQSHEEVSTKRRLIAPQINLNPFWSDDDDQESDLECKTKILEAKPVPKPRTTRNIQELETNEQKSNQNHSSLNTSNSSVASLESATSFGAAYRKKKPAPLPPNRKEQCSPDQHTPLTSSPIIISKTRKTKPAPPPPMQTSVPYNISINTALNCEESPISKSRDATKSNKVWEDEKISKDVANRNRQSFTHTPCKEGLCDRSFVDKSTEGKWKRKKGPAPPCPMPLKRKIKVMSPKDVKLELDEIELQQQGLEKQGVRLEQLIRSKCESESKPDDVLGTAVEELVLELFALVNEKNELFRRQAELMLLRRQQRLEEEHAEVEYQIRCLMSQQESMKTDFDKQREEALIKRLVEIVERRNEIVDCLEMDRRREIEEDRSIHKHMDLFAVKNKNQTSDKDSTHIRKSKLKENKSKDKTKEKKLKKILKKDIDKDIDEIELKLKRHNKRKWF